MKTPPGFVMFSIKIFIFCHLSVKHALKLKKNNLISFVDALKKKKILGVNIIIMPWGQSKGPSQHLQDHLNSEYQM